MVTYLDECVISMLEKNKLCSFIVCRCLFWLKMCETYVQDDVHYNILRNMSEDDLLQSYVGWYKNSLKFNASYPLRLNQNGVFPAMLLSFLRIRTLLSRMVTLGYEQLLEHLVKGKVILLKKLFKWSAKLVFYLCSPNSIKVCG